MFNDEVKEIFILKAAPVYANFVFFIFFSYATCKLNATKTKTKASKPTNVLMKNAISNATINRAIEKVKADSALILPEGMGLSG